MSGKERAQGPLLRVECELRVRPEALSSRLSVMSGKGRGSLLVVECELGARPEALSSGLNMSQLVFRVRYSLVTLLMRRDTCHDLGELFIDALPLLRLLESWEGNQKSEVGGSL